jgi:hypothetical protein
MEQSSRIGHFRGLASAGEPIANGTGQPPLNMLAHLPPLDAQEQLNGVCKCISRRQREVLKESVSLDVKRAFPFRVDGRR